MAKKIQKGKTVKKAEISKKKAIVKKVLAKNISPKKTLSSKVAAKKTLKTSPSKKTVKKAILKPLVPILRKFSQKNFFIGTTAIKMVLYFLCKKLSNAESIY